jgi:RNAse (barnase) inhibitor barstar
MQLIRVDAKDWKTGDDLCQALTSAIQAPEWHGCSIDAFLDSMIWGGLNELNPPYTIQISNLEKAPDSVADIVKVLKSNLDEARIEYRTRRGHDVDVYLEII